MKKTLVIIFLFAINSVFAQKDQLYVFDKDWKPVAIEKAVYLIHVQEISDSSWQWDYYNLYGPLLKTEHYKDKDGNILNGSAYYYNAKGLLDSSGNFIDGKREGDFWKLSEDSLSWKFKYVYKNDSLIETIDVGKKDREDAKEDSIKKSKGIKEKERDEKESEFPGGDAGWARYLNKNLKYPDRAVNGNYEGIVSIAFIVDKEGNVIDPYVGKSVEYSLDNESLLIIKKSGKWIPAIQDGRKVKSYKLQPIQFKLQ
ncbi:MAG: energy transducer TonB [Bacteroidetes bacterium]|nr:energy transducer TonB [Bacteroidota bacterium]